MPKLNNDADRAVWLQCLNAAAAMPPERIYCDTRDPDVAVSQMADRLFEQYQRRCS
jgi:hypothetical protein